MLGVGHTNHIAVQKWFEDSSGIHFTQCHRQVLDMVKTTVPSSAFMYKYVYFAYLSLLVAWDHRLEHSLKVEVIWKLIFQYISFLLCIEQAILCLSHYVQSTQYSSSKYPQQVYISFTLTYSHLYSQGFITRLSHGCSEVLHQKDRATLPPK